MFIIGLMLEMPFVHAEENGVAADMVPLVVQDQGVVVMAFCQATGLMAVWVWRAWSVCSPRGSPSTSA